MWFPQLHKQNSSNNESRLGTIESRIRLLESNSFIPNEDEQDDIVDDYVLMDDGSQVPVTLDDEEISEAAVILPRDDPADDIPPARQCSQNRIEFIVQARKMVAGGKAKTVTEAMKKLRRRKPQLHEDFLRYSADVGRAIYDEL